MAHALMMRGEANLLAVVHNTGLDTGVGAISAINTYYGQHVPIGAYKGQFNKGLRGSYVDDLARNFPNKITNASQALNPQPSTLNHQTSKPLNHQTSNPKPSNLIPKP